MADSLRDQLIAAGFEAPKKQVKKTANQGHGKKSHRNNRPNSGKGNTAKPPAGKTKNKAAGASKSNTADAQAQAAIEERKKLKAQIKTLIDANKLENWKGEIAYRYTVDKRIRELYVNEAGHKQLTARGVAITRLNGDTYLIPIAIATDILTINPKWSVFNTADSDDSSSTQEDEYAEFQVPDDLQW